VRIVIHAVAYRIQRRTLTIPAYGGRQGQEVYFLDSGSVDVTNPESLNDAVRKVKPSIIVNCAGYHDFQGAETDRERAYSLNSFLPRNLARLSLEYRCDFFHVSSTTVFSGKKEKPYLEDDDREPLSDTATPFFWEKGTSRNRAVPGAS
jgi:dTDP-4-dehydrorhamnose reductase